MKPTPGRIVLYRALNGETYVAIVARADRDGVTLIVFYDDAKAHDTAPTMLKGIVEGADPNTWHWPPRVA